MSHSIDPNPDNPAFRVRGRWASSVSLILLAVAVTCSLLGGIDFISGDAHAKLQFKYSYLTAFMFSLSIALGGLFFTMIQHVTGAKWSIVVRRIGEQVMTSLRLMFVLFLPILAWLPDLFPWARPGAESWLGYKIAYLNPKFFLIRAAIYFAVWLGLATLLRRKSLTQDATGDPRIKLSMSRWSAPGILLFSLTITFAAFDWMMSLSPKWYSTIYGVYYFAGSMLAFYATMILVTARIERSGDTGRAINTEHFHDLGKFLFGFTIFWAYIAFSQLLLIWMANIPEETHFFFDRWNAPQWRAVSYFIVFGNFVVPFFYLLPRTIKRFRPTLILGALMILVVHYVDMVYLVMPAFSPEHVAMSVRQPLLCIGMFSFQLSYIFWIMQKDALVPVRDAKLGASMAFENF